MIFYIYSIKVFRKTARMFNVSNFYRLMTINIAFALTAVNLRLILWTQTTSDEYKYIWIEWFVFIIGNYKIYIKKKTY